MERYTLTLRDNHTGAQLALDISDPKQLLTPPKKGKTSLLKEFLNDFQFEAAMHTIAPSMTKDKPRMRIEL